MDVITVIRSSISLGAQLKERKNYTFTKLPAGGGCLSEKDYEFNISNHEKSAEFTVSITI